MTKSLYTNKKQAIKTRKNKTGRLHDKSGRPGEKKMEELKGAAVDIAGNLRHLLKHLSTSNSIISGYNLLMPERLKKVREKRMFASTWILFV